MDSTTREPSLPRDPASPPPPVIGPADPVPPAGVALVRWSLLVHTGLWVLIGLAQAIALATGSAGPAGGQGGVGGWLRLVLTVLVSLAFGAVAHRFGPGRPLTWSLAVLLALLATVAYAGLAWLLATGPAPAPAPVLLTLVVGTVAVLGSAAGLVVLLGGSVRGWCRAQAFRR